MTTYPSPQFANYAINCQAAPYGADPTGVADSTIAIQAALTAGAGGAVFLPPGTYLISANLFIYSGTDFFGCGSSSILQMSAANWAPHPATPTNAAYILLSNHGGSAISNSDSNITVRDMAMYGNPYASGTAWGVNGSLMRFIGGSNMVARNLHFRYNNIGIGVVGTKNWIIDNIIHDYLAGFVTSIWWGAKRGIIRNVIGTTDESIGAIGAGVIQINAGDNSGNGPNYITQDIDVSGISFYGAADSAVQLFPLGDSQGNSIQDVRMRGICITETSGQFSGMTINGNCQRIVLSDFVISGMNRAFPALNMQQGDSGGLTYFPNGVTISDGIFNNCTTPLNGLINVALGTAVTITNISQVSSNYAYAIVFGSTITNVAVSNIQCNTATTSKYFQDQYALVDYLMGSFTPVLQFGGSAAGWTLSAGAVSWTRQERVVSASGFITVGAVGSATGSATIVTFPYGTNAASLAMVTAIAGVIGVTGVPILTFGGATASLVKPDNSGPLTHANFQVGTTIYFVVQYTI